MLHTGIRLLIRGKYFGKKYKNPKQNICDAYYSRQQKHTMTADTMRYQNYHEAHRQAGGIQVDDSIVNTLDLERFAIAIDWRQC